MYIDDESIRQSYVWLDEFAGMPYFHMQQQDGAWLLAASSFSHLPITSCSNNSTWNLPPTNINTADTIVSSVVAIIKYSVS